LFTSTSGALLEQKCRDIDTLSGLIGTGAGGSGISVELFFTPASGTNFVLEHALGTDVFTWDMWSTQFDPIRTIQPTNVYPSGNDHVAIEIDIPASGRLVLTAGGAGPSGTAGPTGPEGPSGPQGPTGSGASIELFFTPLSGTLFVLEHTLNTDIFTWDMWSTQFDPILSIQPTTVSPSGNSHVIVELDIPVSGRLVLTAGGTGPSGVAGPPGPSGSSGTKKLLFTPPSGTLFVMEHGLGTEDFVWNLWSIDTNPIRTVEPVNIAPSGSDRVIVELDLPMSGKLTLVAVLDE